MIISPNRVSFLANKDYVLSREIDKPSNKNPISSSFEFSKELSQALKAYSISFMGTNKSVYPTKDKLREIENNFCQLRGQLTPDNDVQAPSIESAKKGNNVVITAPTGTGKTLIFEHLMMDNLKNQKLTIYTSPLKALSNQKYHDFQKLFGQENVGLLTGDHKENVNAPILVMTTEIYDYMLRNLLTKKDSSEGNDANLKMESFSQKLEAPYSIIFDEFHFMDDRERGTVWEDSVMNSPKNVQIIVASATIGNANKINNWIHSITGNPTELIQSDHRHVPLRVAFFNGVDLVLAGTIDDLKEDKSIITSNITDLVHMSADEKSLSRGQKAKCKESRGVSKDRYNEHSISNLVQLLKQGVPSEYKKFESDHDSHNGMLPAIIFVMSRKGCDSVAEQLSNKLDSLLSVSEKAELNNIWDKYSTQFLGDIDKNKLKQQLEKGIAVHHSGMMPQNKQMIEELFQKGLIKAVVATTTLAAGINMPAKTVVITEQELYDGDSRRSLTANEFNQMIGRAGRRGKDDVGNAIILAKNGKEVEQTLSFVTDEPDNLSSHYKPSVGFLLNFLKDHDINELEGVIKKSFACFESQNGNKESQEIMADYKMLIESLEKLGYLEKDGKDGKYSLEVPSEIASQVIGIDEILMTELLLNGEMEKLSPEELAGLVSSLTSVSHSSNESRSEKFNLKNFKHQVKLFEKLFDAKAIIDQLCENYDYLTSTDVNHHIAPFITRFAQSNEGNNSTKKVAWGNTLDQMKAQRLIQNDGDLFRIVNQTKDFLKQISKLAKACRDLTDDSKERANFLKLQQNANKAIDKLRIPN